MIKIDFHTHTFFSYDSFMRPEKILRLADERGLDYIVINDHNTINGGLACKELEKNYKVKVIVGSEIKTDIGDVTGIFLKEEIPQGNYQEIVEKIKIQGGLSILNHPFVGHNLSHVNFSAFDLIEGFNGRCTADENAKAIALAVRHNKPYVAGSDSHLYSEIGTNYSEFVNVDDIRNPGNHVHSKSHSFYKVCSQLIKGYKNRDLSLISKVLLSAPKKLITNR